MPECKKDLPQGSSKNKPQVESAKQLEDKLQAKPAEKQAADLPCSVPTAVESNAESEAAAGEAEDIVDKYEGFVDIDLSDEPPTTLNNVKADPAFIADNICCTML